MPIYEYECERCSFRFDLRKSFSEEEDACCPRCQSEARRLFSPVPIIFKGSGFYVTDNKAAGEVKPPSKRGNGDKNVAKTPVKEAKEEPGLCSHA